MKRMITVAVAMIAATMGSLIAAGPASAQETGTRLLVTTPSGSVVLLCDPAGGTHPKATAACLDIAAVNGNFHQMKPIKGRYCIQVWDPVEVSVTGYWKGKRVYYGSTESNASCAKFSHGRLFDY